MGRARAPRRVVVQSGQLPLAPRVDDPRGFAIENDSGRPLTVSFRYDSERHLQTVVIEEPRPARPAPTTLEDYAGEPVWSR